jgi:GTP cyclohydrolase II
MVGARWVELVGPRRLRRPGEYRKGSNEMYVPAEEIRPRLQVMARAPVPTRFGLFHMVVFRYEGLNRAAEEAAGLSPDHVALVMGDLKGREGALVRIHSECLTSEVFGSLKCDCAEQLRAAQATIARDGAGAVLYLRQEGRGIGLANKIRAYELQASGTDTVDANRLLGLPDDTRDYAPAAAMLEHLGARSVRLMTNNPLKVQQLRAHGVRVLDRVSAFAGSNPHSKGYLEAKRLRMGHALPPLELREEAD